MSAPQDETEGQSSAALRKAEYLDLPPITIDDLEARVRRWMIVPDKGVIKLLCAHYVANKLGQRPVWLMFVAPSGGGKTELLNGLLDMPDVVPISILTPNTFLSGMPGPNDASLLPQLSGKIMMFKDWTTMLSMQKDARAELMSQFREIYDGGLTKIFGNGKRRKWEGKVSVIAGSTQAVDLQQQQYTHLGERFLTYRIDMPDRKKVAMRSLDNTESANEMVSDMQKAYFQFFNDMDWTTLKLPDLPYEVKGKLVDLANFCTKARSGVIRDTGMKKEVIFVPTAEMPTRIVQQLHLLAASCAIVNKGKGLLDVDMDIIYKLALDCIPQTNRMVIMEMAKANQQTTKEIATALGYPTGPIRTYLENMTLLGVATRIDGRESDGGGNADKWTLDPEFTAIIRKYDGVAELNEQQLLERQEAAKSADEIAADEAWSKF